MPNPLDMLSTSAFEAGSAQRALGSNGGSNTVSYSASSQSWASLAAASSSAWVPASGLNGLPFSMPMVFSTSIIARSRSSQGSACTIRSSERKKRRS